MKISELPEGLRQLAEMERENRGVDYSDFMDDLSDAFRWKYSVHGEEFWQSIYDGNFCVYYDLHGYPAKVYKPLLEMANDREACEKVWKQVFGSGTPTVSANNGIIFFSSSGKSLSISSAGEIHVTCVDCEYNWNTFALVNLIRECGYDVVKS